MTKKVTITIATTLDEDGEIVNTGVTAEEISIYTLLGSLSTCLVMAARRNDIDFGTLVQYLAGMYDEYEEWDSEETIVDLEERS